MKTFIIHVMLNGSEQQVPVIAKDLDDAHEWATRKYEDVGFVVTRVRPKL